MSSHNQPRRPGDWFRDELNKKKSQRSSNPSSYSHFSSHSQPPTNFDNFDDAFDNDFFDDDFGDDFGDDFSNGDGDMRHNPDGSTTMSSGNRRDVEV
ncbi:hypothetical protein M7I_2505 [Glarea lozoyensis 74030]|uniref:Uncharacterized protein n=1 Tax=Glarea lozoyensis (strain ATCC 74030 / MF5533) TaxID=1104152 RepID=H0EIY4_GLAL7|nr:hypothetical protein M7I_2505 [Glarea lozoyensis 74030]